MHTLKTKDYVEMLKNKTGITTQYGLAKYLGITIPAVRRWDKGLSTFDDHTALIIAEKLEIDPSIIITSCHLERALKNDDFATAGVYRNMLEKLTPLAIKGASAVAAYGALASLSGCFGGF